MPESRSIFISYRRRDASAIARWLEETIEQNFGKSSVFIDTDAIEMADEWPARIQDALDKASVMLVLIGPDWLRSHDEYGSRRLDNPKDWVRMEILHALEKGLKIYPILISKADLPEAKGLPEELRPLLNHQSFNLREAEWRTDIAQLLKKLEADGMMRIAPQVHYPAPFKKAEALSEKELEEFCEQHREWKLVSRTVPSGEKRLELMRIYEFRSFEDAIHFMFAAARHISRIDHHPDWENIWRTLTVWLTTWDIGHRPSHYDVEVAQYLDELFENYV